MRVHLLAQPNVMTTSAYHLDGFCTMTMRFASLLKRMGAEVILYAGDSNEAECDELVTCITEAELKGLLAGGEYQKANIHPDNPIWKLASPRMIAEIGRRKQPRDFICFIGGGSQIPVISAHPDLMDVEYSIGYIGNCARYRVFQSNAWRHMCYGAQQFWDGGRFFDTVIPGFFDATKFPEKDPEGYALYVGRYIPKKGIAVACEAAKLAGMPLKLVGHGDASLITYGENLGAVDEATRNDLMARASVLICPTVYVEPYGCIAPEAMMCGTPVVSTDFGGFTETVIPGFTGYRANLLGEFVRGLQAAQDLDRSAIREFAQATYSMEAVQPLYENYFARLSTLWSEGWRTL